MSNITPKPLRILAFASSTRKESYNKKIVKIATLGAQSTGIETNFIDLKDYPMPFYDGDLQEEKGLPENAKKLQKLFMEHDAFLIGTAEYNSSITGVFKNTIDWISRQEHSDSPNLIAFKDKFALLISASPGIWGGIRSMIDTRKILADLGVTVLATSRSLSKAHEAFDAQGNLDTHHTEVFKQTGITLANFLKQFKG
jgi:chromate reductase